MTLEDIRALVVSVDKNAGRYESAYQGGQAYTVWREFRRLDMMADDRHEEAWAFQIDRFTKTEGDGIAAAFLDALEADERVAYSCIVDYEPDTGYIHHIYDCEGY